MNSLIHQTDTCTIKQNNPYALHDLHSWEIRFVFLWNGFICPTTSYYNENNDNDNEDNKQNEDNNNKDNDNKDNDNKDNNQHYDSENNGDWSRQQQLGPICQVPLV